MSEFRMKISLQNDDGSLLKKFPRKLNILMFYSLDTYGEQIGKSL